MVLGPKDPTTIDIQEILELIPHRYPFLLVDRIVSLAEDGKSCVGLKNVTMNEPFFQGHYPGLPIMPGVLVMECMAQVGAILAARVPSLAGLVPLIGAIEGAKFRRPVRPGDQLLIEVRMLWLRGAVGRMKGTVRIGEDVAAEMEMVFKLSRKEAPQPEPAKEDRQEA